MPLPPEDRVRSPYTGWTRAHWEHAADRMLMAVRPFATPGHGLVNLPGPESRSGRWSDGLEGFARTFLLAAFRLAQHPDAGHGEWYAAGLAAGTAPGAAERWPRPDEIPQARVEAASIALAVHESGLWASLDEGVRERLVAWLSPMRRAAVPANNWVWFRAIVSAFLRRVGAAWEPRDLEEAEELTERWYAGDGWYTDGDGRHFDYYNAWALHFYPLWLSRIAGEPPPARYRERLARFLADAQHLVAPDGAPLLQGRSLTYRFGMLAPFWTAAVCGVDALSPGRTRRLASAVLRHFLAHGCLDARGLLPLGWHGAFPAIRQTYSGPGSPYWAAKGFAGLVLPPEHPVWTATEEPLELEERDVELVVRPAGWLVSGSGGIVRVANHGTSRGPVAWLGSASAPDAAPPADDPFYARHAYATHAAPQVAGDPVDSHVALLDERGRPSHRGPMETLAIGPRHAVSRFRARGAWVTTASALHGPWEVRLARPEAALRLRIGGFALAGERIGPGRVRRADGVTSTVTALRGLDTVDCVRTDATDAFGDPAWIPVAETAGPARPGHVHAALIMLTRSDAPGALALTVDDEATVEIRWPDGELDRVELRPSAGASSLPAERPTVPGARVMAYTVDFHTVSTVGLESSPVADALAGLRANEARYFKNKYDHDFTVEPASEAEATIEWVHRILEEERDIVISSRPLEATAFQVENIRMAYVFYESGLSVNVMYTIDSGGKRAVGFKLSEGMDIPAELEPDFKFARQKSKLAGTIRGSYFVIKGEY